MALENSLEAQKRWDYGGDYGAHDDVLDGSHERECGSRELRRKRGLDLEGGDKRVAGSSLEEVAVEEHRLWELLQYGQVQQPRKTNKKERNQ